MDYEELVGAGRTCGPAAGMALAKYLGLTLNAAPKTASTEQQSSPQRSLSADDGPHLWDQQRVLG